MVNIPCSQGLFLAIIMRLNLITTKLRKNTTHLLIVVKVIFFVSNKFYWEY